MAGGGVESLMRNLTIPITLHRWAGGSLTFSTSVGQLNSGDSPQPQVYSSLLSSGCQAGEHAACFAELRRNFVNKRPVKLKNLMLLVKHWYRQVSTLPLRGSRHCHGRHRQVPTMVPITASFQVVLHPGQLLEPSLLKAISHSCH